MCAVSFIGDRQNGIWKESYPKIWETVSTPAVTKKDLKLLATKEEVEKLRQELEALKKLLKAAKIFDEEVGEPDCKQDNKVAIIKKMAELLEVDLEDLFD